MFVISDNCRLHVGQVVISDKLINTKLSTPIWKCPSVRYAATV